MNRGKVASARLRRSRYAGILIALCAAHGGPAVAQSAYFDAANVQRWASGRYAYISTRTGEQNGDEDWLLTVHADGSRTLQSTNSYNDHTKTWRNVVLRVAPDFRPVEAHLTFWVDGAWRGSGWFTVDGNELLGQVSGPGGRIERKLNVPEHFSLVPHPIATDSWPTWYYDYARGGLQKVTLYAFDGQALGPTGMFGKLNETEIEYRGQQTIEIPAGTFETEHFVFAGGDPQLYLVGEDRIIAKMTWQRAEVEYVLTAYASGP